MSIRPTTWSFPEDILLQNTRYRLHSLSYELSNLRMPSATHPTWQVGGISFLAGLVNSEKRTQG